MITINISTYKREATAEEAQAHGAWLVGLDAEGILVGAGLRSTSDGGVVVLRGESATNLISEDPFVKLGVAEYTSATFTPALGALKE